MRVKRISGQAEFGNMPAAAAAVKATARAMVVPNDGANWEKSGQAAWNWLAGVGDRFDYLRAYGAEVIFPANKIVTRAIKLGGAR